VQGVQAVGEILDLVHLAGGQAIHRRDAHHQRPELGAGQDPAVLQQPGAAGLFLLQAAAAAVLLHHHLLARAQHQGRQGLGVVDQLQTGAFEGKDHGEGAPGHGGDPARTQVRVEAVHQAITCLPAGRHHETAAYTT